MTDKQRFLVSVHLGGLLAAVREAKGIGIREAVEMLLASGVVQKLEDIETGYYLESDGYLKRELIGNVDAIYQKDKTP